MTAERWKDAQLWVRSARVCGVDQRIELLGVEGFLSALKVFEFEAIREL